MGTVRKRGRNKVGICYINIGNEVDDVIRNNLGCVHYVLNRECVQTLVSYYNASSTIVYNYLGYM